jgi:hypothetical protein
MAAQQERRNRQIIGSVVPTTPGYLALLVTLIQQAAIIRHRHGEH